MGSREALYGKNIGSFITVGQREKKATIFWQGDKMVADLI